MTQAIDGDSYTLGTFSWEIDETPVVDALPALEFLAEAHPPHGLDVAPEYGPIPPMAPDLLREFDASARAFVDRLVPMARALARLQDEAAARLHLRPTLLADHGLCLGIQLMARLLDEAPTTLERDTIEIPSGMATTSPIIGRSGDLVHVEARVPLGIELPEATVDLGVMTVAFDGELVAEGHPRGAGRDLWAVPSGQVTARLHPGTTETPAVSAAP